METDDKLRRARGFVFSGEKLEMICSAPGTMTACFQAGVQSWITGSFVGTCVLQRSAEGFVKRDKSRRLVHLFDCVPAPSCFIFPPVNSVTLNRSVRSKQVR